MTEIYINNQLIDLFSNEEVVLTFGVNDLFSIETRQGTYSNTFKIPATHNNNQILEQANNILSTTEIFTQKLPCRILVDGILQVDGLAEVKSGNEIEYELNVYAGNSNWFESIENKSLRDYMNSCNFAFNWTETHVTANRSNNVWTDAFLYPNIDYGNLFFKPPSPGPPYEVEWYELYPAVYCKYLFKEIFDEAGYVINSDWFDNNTLFAKQIIPFSSLWQRDKNYTKRNYFLWEADLDHTSPIVSVDDVLFYGVNVNAPFSKYEYRDENCYQFPAIQDWEYIYTTPTPSAFITKDMLWINNDSGKATINYNITVEKITAVSPAFAKVGIAYYNSDGFFDTDYVFQLLLDLQTAPVGTIQNIQGSITINDFGRGAFSLFIGTLEIKQGSTFEFELEAFGEDNGELDITDRFPFFTLGSTLPDMPAKDFILTIANQYGLIFEQETLNNTINIYQFDKLLNNQISALDWSNKIDLQDYPTITYLSKDYQRNNYLRYAEDSEDEYLTELGNYGEGNIIIDTSQSGTEQEIFVSEFAPVIRIKTFANGVAGAGVMEMAYIPIFESGTFTQVTPRMAYVEFDNSTSTIIMPGLSQVIPEPNVYFADLVFQNLIDEYYGEVRAIIKSGKAVSCLLRINNLDITNLDFSKPIWIDYFNAYFYINEITQYKVTSKDSTQVTLILLTN